MAGWIRGRFQISDSSARWSKIKKAVLIKEIAGTQKLAHPGLLYTLAEPEARDTMKRNATRAALILLELRQTCHLRCGDADVR